MQLTEYLQQKTQSIAQYLTEFVHDQEQQSLAFNYPVMPFLKKFVVSGKMYRGALVFLGYDLFADQFSEDLPEGKLANLLKVSTALELIHSAFLIHDDVIDQDDYRRGRPSFHALVKDFFMDKFAKNLTQNQAAQNQAAQYQHLGYSQAICLGDMLIFWANQLMQEVVCQLNQPGVFAFYTQEMVKTCWGQMDDVCLANLDISPTLKEIENVMTLKSGHYSIVNPLVLGAMMAAASEEQQQLLIEYGLSLGIFFQVKDDELGLIGNQAQLGKPVGSDVIEDKKTLYRHFLFQQANDQDKQKLQEMFGNPDLTGDQLSLVQSFLQKYQVQSLVDEYLQHQQQQAQKAVEELALKDESEQLLKELMQLLKKRKK